MLNIIQGITKRNTKIFKGEKNKVYDSVYKCVYF